MLIARYKTANRKIFADGRIQDIVEYFDSKLAIEHIPFNVAGLIPPQDHNLATSSECR
jgi:hypothetical protein